VCAAGRATSTARIAAQLARAEHPGEQATLLLDGSRTTCVGAAFANGVLANALDFDDGHRIARGHPGAIVIPAVLATAEFTGASSADALSAIAIGYEVAIRAAIDLHAREGGYAHASGAWGALGAAAAAGRLLGLDVDEVGHALGLAEYHAPQALIMRSVAAPAMTKDACAWGALVGVHAALLARHGFTAVPAVASSASAVLDDLGELWRINEVYVKPFPCCRWSQAAVEAALALRREHRLDPRDIARVEVRAFAAALELAADVPSNGDEVQYSLTWPVSVALARGAFTVEDVLAIDRDQPDPLVAALHGLVEATIDERFESAFPDRRLSEVVVFFDSGAEVRSGPMEAPGEPGDPRWRAIIDAKVKRYAPWLDDEGAASQDVPAAALWRHLIAAGGDADGRADGPRTRLR
jgi:2-methylcitrate dehydratase PrpD